MIKQAIVLAGGEGYRLRPFTLNRPKPMLAVAGRPLIEYAVRALVACGIRDIVVVVGYRKEQLFDYLGDGSTWGARISYAVQPQQLGSANALEQAEKLADDEFLVLPGDKYFSADTIAGLISQSPSAMLLKTASDPLRDNIVVVEGERVVRPWLPSRYSGSPQEEGIFTINTGIYALNREVFGYLKGEPHLPAALMKMVLNNHPMRAFFTEGEWQDVLYPWDIIAINEALMSQIEPLTAGTIEPGVNIRGGVTLGNGSLIRGGSYIEGPVVIGRGCTIGPNASLGAATSLGDNVVVGPFSHITDSVIGDDVHIGPGCIIQRSVIDRGVSLGGHFQAMSDEAEVKIGTEYHSAVIGCLLGESCLVGGGVVALPGVTLGAYSKVAALKGLRGSLPDRSLLV
jgi:glucose-1-phosphate thymidylyltransferase